MLRRSGVRIAAAVIAVMPLLAIQSALPPYHPGTRCVSSDDARLAATSVMFDDFTGPAGAPPDPRWWTYDTGGGGWGNGESQIYTRVPKNVRLDGAGRLVIEARNDGGTYTAARITTADRVSFLYGRAEARIKLPRGSGLHPAFWLMGTDLSQVNWPKAGEIDVIETTNNAGDLYNALHGPTDSGAQWKSETANPVDSSFVDDFHTYWVRKDPNRITIGVDDWVTADFRREDLHPDQQWVFNKPFFLLLNVAVGGDWPGPADSSTPFPAEMVIDWVRVTGG